MVREPRQARGEVTKGFRAGLGPASQPVEHPDLPSLQAHPKLGASWEGFVVEQILSWAGERNAYYWGTHGGAKLDLLVIAKGKRWGFEVKYQDAPTITKSMRVAMQDLKLERHRCSP